MNTSSTTSSVASAPVAPAQLAPSTPVPVTPSAPAPVAPVRQGVEKPSWLSGRGATPVDAAAEPSDAGATPKRMALYIALAIAATVLVLYFIVPVVRTAFTTVSTDDAYVNGHVTFVAPRVGGQVTRVLVDDNIRVKRGDVLVELDPEPFRVAVEVKKAAVDAAEAELVVAQANVRGLEAAIRSERWQLETSMEQVATQIANLHANVATYKSNIATRDLGLVNLHRAERLAPKGAISQEELDERIEQTRVDEASVEQALQNVYATRVALGLSAKPAEGGELDDTPADLVQTFSQVRAALASMIETMAQIGLPLASVDATPEAVLEQFHLWDEKGNANRVLEELVPESPEVKQAEANVLQARRDLEQAELDLRYCTVVSDIDGVVTRRNVNPGNNVTAGQSLMAVRSLTEIWVDANFKETQLANLRIGQPVSLEVDMYGGRREFKGRISGFEMGTGQTLALLPPQNATGNFVKIVQRLPVRIDLVDYDPDVAPLFVGLSVEPYVYYRKEATGPNAGKFLQYPLQLPTAAVDPTPGG
ncbi:efflux RND transporter periplasmic adaptor subunit [Lacipirellula sp.]|uniref:efflux RND transporter periplasmic adaptor subunit n=1 Tax=Lacipirellula sp. TaxID=2691419 RepID=UPI003D0C1649